jgi:UDP-GlcNAc:undecaprenyl-phosphate GlcNAc-1-phosphate transferase
MFTIENFWIGATIVFLLSALLSMAINLFMLRYTGNIFSKNLPENTVRFSTARKPAIGGVSFFACFLFGIIAYLLFFPYERGSLNTLEISAIISTVSMGFILGLYDDLRNSPVWIKFLVQFSIAGILIASGISIELFQGLPILNYVLTVIWVVGIMNSINMLDNMDAITTITSLSIFTTVLVIIGLKQDFLNPDFIIMLAVAGGLIGFLRYNWNPSKIYMGDVGSQFLGVVLAIVGIKYFWNFSDTNDMLVNSKQIIVIAMAFILPITDTTTVFYKRIARGQSPFIGGADHTTHHLSYIGLSVRQVGLLFLTIGVLSALFIVTILTYISIWSYWHFAIFAVYILIVFVSLFYIANLNKNKN